LEADVVWLKKTFGRLDPPLAELLRIRRGSVTLPFMGGTDTLRTGTIGSVDPKGAVFMGGGDSFIMLVNWDKQGAVSSQSVVPYGSSSRPNSPHYTDQMKLFVEKQFKPVHFEWADALAHGGKPYRP
jgi:acyl-homoserine-lactone acylase